MRISARNQIKGTVTEVKKRATTSHVRSRYRKRADCHSLNHRKHLGMTLTDMLPRHAW